MNVNEFLPCLPFSGKQTAAVFDQLHLSHTELHYHWSLSATRRKLVAGFWLETLSCHFIPIWIYSVVLVLLFLPATFSSSLPVFFVSGIAVYLLLLPTLYLPVFHFDFLPSIDNYIEYQKNELLSGVQKCKKEQYPVLTLLLIQIVYEKMVGIPTPGIQENYIQLLVKQYGISSKSVDAGLRIILFKQWDRSRERKRTEINDAFEKAKTHFQLLQITAAVSILDQLQLKLTK